MALRVLKWVVIVAVLIQLVPYGHSHTNPPVMQEPAWNSPQTRMLFKRACFDCHSNQTVWPWYAYVAPVSWLLQNDVSGGRSHLNVSEWNRPQRDAKNVAKEVKEGDMPPWYFLPMHPAARLSEAEKQSLIDGAEKTFGPQAPAKH